MLASQACGLIVFTDYVSDDQDSKTGARCGWGTSPPRFWHRQQVVIARVNLHRFAWGCGRRLVLGRNLT